MAHDKDRQPPDGSAGNPLSEIPAGAQKQIIIAAAAVSGRPANEITLAEALEILQGDNPNPYLNAAMNKAAEDAAGALFGGMTDEQIEEYAEAAKRGDLQEGLRAAIMAFIEQMQDGSGTPAADQQQGGETPVKENQAAAADDPDDAGRVIRVQVPKPDPTLDPNSPDFDFEKWKESTAGARERLKETAEKINTGLADAYKGLFAAADIGTALAARLQEMQAAFSGIGETAIEAFRNAQAAARFTQSESWQKIRETLKEIAESAPLWLEIITEITELQPFIDAELKKPDYEGKSFDELYETGIDDETGDIIPDSLFAKLITAARAAREAAQPKTAIKRAQTIEYPLDKPNSIIWNLLEKDTRGQISFNLAKVGSKKQIPAYYAINFDDLGDDIQITKRLLPTDKRVYIAISALYNAENNVITLTQIYYAMGYTGRPGTKDLTRINESITKMTGAKIFFDNKAEADAYKNYTRFKYDGSLLPLERGTAIVNGQLADAAIHIFREPPLITFAKQRRQITSVDVKLLQSPVSKTDANLQIEDYLLERISRAQNGKGKSCRILFETLYKHTNITTKKQKQRAPAKIEKYLQYYKQQEFLTDYTIETDGITLYWK